MCVMPSKGAHKRIQKQHSGIYEKEKLCQLILIHLPLQEW